MRVDISGTDEQKIRRYIQGDPVLRGLLTKTLPEVNQWLASSLTSQAALVNLLKSLTALVWFLGQNLKGDIGSQGDPG
jgi:hypothetical protein